MMCQVGQLPVDNVSIKLFEADGAADWTVWILWLLVHNCKSLPLLGQGHNGHTADTYDVLQILVASFIKNIQMFLAFYALCSDRSV